MKLAANYPVRLLCRLLDLPRSTLYYHAHPGLDEAMLKTALLDLAAEWPTYGYRRLTWMMRRLGWPLNYKRVRRWMDELALHGAPPTRRRRTTNSNHPFPRYPNLVQSLEITRPDQVWVADITYIRLRREFVYLAVLMDVFTRSLRGWHLGRNLDQGLTLAALERALVVAVPQLHHSDQGVQYAATDYVERLQRLGVTLSMAAVGEPRENGYAERLVRTIKEEEVDLSDYHDFADAHRQITRFLDDVYNRKRIHSSLGYLTPREFEDQWRRQPASPPAEQGRGKEGGGPGRRETGAAGSRPPDQAPSSPQQPSTANRPPVIP
jgi:putative transposase